MKHVGSLLAAQLPRDIQTRVKAEVTDIDDGLEHEHAHKLIRTVKKELVEKGYTLNKGNGVGGYALNKGNGFCPDKRYPACGQKGHVVKYCPSKCFEGDTRKVMRTTKMDSGDYLSVALSIKINGTGFSAD